MRAIRNVHMIRLTECFHLENNEMHEVKKAKAGGEKTIYHVCRWLQQAGPEATHP